MENYIVINGKKAELTPEQLKALGIEVKKSSLFERVYGTDNLYYCIRENGIVTGYRDGGDFSGSLHQIANYCTDRKLMQQRAYLEILNRLLWRYSIENDGDKIDWSSCAKKKYYIILDKNKFDVTWTYACGNIFNTYFISQSVAEAAIKEIVEPFMEAHPDFKL